MKSITTIAACLLTALALTGNAWAQDHAAKAEIPFGFHVGNQWLPAGTYIMTSQDNHPNVVEILNGDKKVVQMSVVRPERSKSVSNTLVFKKYGDHFFLHQIQCASCGMNVAFSESKGERWAQTREASLPSGTDVLLALK